MPSVPADAGSSDAGGEGPGKNEVQGHDHSQYQSKGDGEVLLVLEGVKMGASVTLNGHALGNVTDQFLRHAYPVATVLRSVLAGALVLLGADTSRC